MNSVLNIHVLIDFRIIYKYVYIKICISVHLSLYKYLPINIYFINNYKIKLKIIIEQIFLKINHKALSILFVPNGVISNV